MLFKYMDAKAEEIDWRITKLKQKLKMWIDFVMTVLLICQMSYMLIGEKIHEWAGTAMFLFFILHHILNWRWYRNLIRGTYTAVRIVQIIVNFLVLSAMLGLMVSGMMMSREVFGFLSINGGMGFARLLHMLAAYWGFFFMSIHIGLHWGTIMGMAKKLNGRKERSLTGTWILRCMAAGISAFGIYGFWKHRMTDYLFLKSQFVFFDINQSLVLFFLEYLAMMGLWICIAYYVGKLARGNKFYYTENKNL